MAKLTIIVDGNLIARKSFHTLNSFHLEDGTPTGVMYGCINTLLMLINKFNPDQIIWCWDGGSQRRKKLDATYKANRVLANDSPLFTDHFFQQVGITEQLMNMMGVDQGYMPGEEADDVIGTLATRFAQNKEDTVMIVSNDYDFMQLLETDNICMFWSSKDKEMLYNKQKIQEEFGIDPKQFVDVYALAGDKTDNITGCPGIGEKGAINLIKELKTVDSLIEKAEALLPKKKADALLAVKNKILLNKQLVKIVTDLPVELIKGKPELDTVKVLFREWFGFYNFLGRWDEITNIATKGVK